MIFRSIRRACRALREKLRRVWPDPFVAVFTLECSLSLANWALDAATFTRCSRLCSRVVECAAIAHAGCSFCSLPPSLLSSFSSLSLSLSRYRRPFPVFPFGCVHCQCHQKIGGSSTDGTKDSQCSTDIVHLLWLRFAESDLITGFVVARAEERDRRGMAGTDGLHYGSVAKRKRQNLFRSRYSGVSVRADRNDALYAQRKIYSVACFKFVSPRKKQRNVISEWQPS